MSVKSFCLHENVNFTGGNVSILFPVTVFPRRRSYSSSCQPFEPLSSINHFKDISVRENRQCFSVFCFSLKLGESVSSRDGSLMDTFYERLHLLDAAAAAIEVSP